MTISGGRKDMSIMMALVAQIAGVDGVYHIIHKDVVRYNVMLERMRHKIDELAKSESPRNYYETHQHDFEQLMFPELAELSIVRLPILPYPRSHLLKLLNILEKGGTVLDVERTTIEALERSEVITETRGKLLPTDISRKIARAMRRAVW
jgi:hypothetical protein